MTELYELQKRLEMAITEAQQAADAVNAALQGAGHIAPGTYGATRSVIRDLLRNKPDGMTAPELCKRTGYRDNQIRTALQRMPETYVDRWELAIRRSGYPYVAVWCLSDTPQPDCPKPPSKKAKK